MHCRALLLVAATALAAENPTFHLDFTLVPVETRVYEPETGASIPGLTASDFVLYDENSPREIAYFSHGTEPLDLVLLLDISGTMREVLEPVARQAGDALSALRPGDRASVMVFGKSVQLTQPLTSNFKKIAAGLPRSFFAHVGTDTDINNAVVLAAEYLRSSDRLARRAVLLVTDNMQATQTRDVAVERELFEAGATLDGIVISGRVKLPAFLRGHTGAYRFAQRTGGEVLEGRHPADDIARMIDRIRTRYTLYFRPAEGSEARRRIRVELTKKARERHPKAIVRARTYYFPAETRKNSIAFTILTPSNSPSFSRCRSAVTTNSDRASIAHSSTRLSSGSSLTESIARAGSTRCANLNICSLAACRRCASQLNFERKTRMSSPSMASEVSIRIRPTRPMFTTCSGGPEDRNALT